MSKNLDKVQKVLKSINIATTNIRLVNDAYHIELDLKIKNKPVEIKISKEGQLSEDGIISMVKYLLDSKI